MFNFKTWRAENDKFALQRHCLGILSKNGWRVGGGEGGSDSRVGKGDLALLLFFVAKKTPVHRAMLADWLEAKSAGKLPIVVIVAEEVAVAMDAAARERGVRILHYKNLESLAAETASPRPQVAAMVEAATRVVNPSPPKPKDDTGAPPPGGTPPLHDGASLQSLRDIARADAARGDWLQALESWTLVQQRFADDMSGYLGSAVSLRQLRRFREAEDLLLTAQARFPLQQQPSVDLASLAFETRAFDIALERSKTVRDRFPISPNGWIGIAKALKELGRLSEAESAIETALHHFPSDRHVYFEYASIPQKKNDWEESAGRFAALRTKFPDFETAYSAGSVPLRALKRFADADALLSDAQKRFPNFQQAAIDYAKVAEEQGDHQKAALRWQEFRTKFPNRPIGYIAASHALEKLGRLVEAEQLMKDAVARFPADEAALARYAGLAQKHSTQQTPVEPSVVTVVRAPTSKGAPSAAQPVRDPGADRLLARLIAWQASARDSAIKGEWPAALAAWRRVRDAYPDDVSGYTGVAQALRRMGRFEEAEADLRTAIDKFPNHADPVVDLARLALEQRDHALALKRWQYVKDAHPGHLSGWVGVAAALRELERLPEAEAAADAAFERFPQKIETHVERARVAQAKSDWAEAAHRWRIVREKFPEFEPAYTSCCWSLRCLKRYDEAATILESAMRLFPNYAQAAIEYARISQDQDNWAEALRRWRHVQETFPGNVVGHAGLAASLERLGIFAEAEQVTRAALQRFPTDETCLVVFARLAAARSDWNEAQSRWKTVLDRYPNSALARVGYGKTRVLAQLEAAMAGGSPPSANNDTASGNDPSKAVANRSSVPAVTPEAVLARFESLGGNCEFGLVQRQFGIEPLGLLRWTGIAPKMLAAALRAGFEGVGDAENTILTTINGEWVSSDKRWNLVMHTFVQEKQSTYEALYPKICSRLKFLKSKLIEDLRQAEKIFVYQHPTGVTDSDIDVIAAEIRNFGDATLLFVRVATEQHPSGSIDKRNDRLYVGYVDRLGPLEVPGLPPSWSKIPFDVWLKVCQSVMVLRESPDQQPAGASS